MIPLLLLLSPARAAESFGEYAFYLGDIHVHTGASRDGGSTDVGTCDATCGAAADLASIALSNGLDFFTVTDHTNGGYTAVPADFNKVWDIALAANDPRTGLVVIPGAEIHFRDLERHDLGHKTLLLFGRDDALASFTEADAQPSGSDAMEMNCADIWPYMADIQARFGPALLLPHHPALLKPMPTDFTCDDPEWSPVVEIYSRQGNSLSCDDPYDPPWSTCVPEGTVDYAADPAGLALRFGFAGGTDSHDTNPGGVCQPERINTNAPYGGGLTIAVLSEDTTFDRTGLYDAFVDKQVYTTSGPFVPALVQYSTGGAELGGMSAYAGLPAGQPLDISLSLPPDDAPSVTMVRLLGPYGTVGELTEAGDGAWSGTLSADEIPAWIVPDIVLDGDIWYGADGCDDGGTDNVEHVWLSPTWFDPADPDLDRDGVSWADGDCDDGDAGISPGSPEICDGAGVDEDCDGLVDAADPDCANAPDTAPTADTSGESADSGEEPKGTGGQAPTCGCAADGGWASAWAWAATAVLLARRRR